MKVWSLLALLFVVLVEPATSQISKKSSKNLGPKSITNWRMHYADNFADYIYRFGKNGHYELVFVSKGGEKPEAERREGTFSFKRSSESKARLMIDDEDWSLKFDRSNRADATLKGESRSLIFFFEEPK